jgi:putative transport protein
MYPPRNASAAHIVIDWFVNTPRSCAEIAPFRSSVLGYFFGSFTYKGLGLLVIGATLMAGVHLGQLEIMIAGHLRPIFFMMFVFALGYAVGPQLVRDIARNGVPQVFTAAACGQPAAYIGANPSGYCVASAALPYAGSQTTSACLGLASNAHGGQAWTG